MDAGTVLIARFFRADWDRKSSGRKTPAPILPIWKNPSSLRNFHGGG